MENTTKSGRDRKIYLLTMHGSDAFKDLEVPQLDSHVCRAGCEQFAILVKRDVLHRICVALQCAFKVSCLIVPHLEDSVFMHLLQRNLQYIKGTYVLH